MASTGLSGPYTLSEEIINTVVTQTSPGTYVLGHSENSTFIVQYVGRSDNDVNSRLKDWVGKYSQFKCGYLQSAKAAFDKECAIYHDFGGASEQLDNQIHPQRPANTDWQCPKCNAFAKAW